MSLAEAGQETINPDKHKELHPLKMPFFLFMHFVHAPLEDGSCSKPGPRPTRMFPRNTPPGASQLIRADKVG